jgi:hypothetical protein
MHRCLWDVYEYGEYRRDNMYLPLASLPLSTMSLGVLRVMLSFIRPQRSTQDTAENIDVHLSGNEFCTHFGQIYIFGNYI